MSSLKGKSLEYCIDKFDVYNVTNAWIMNYKLCYNIATEENMDVVRTFNKDIRISIGDKIPPINLEDALIDIDIIDKSELINKLEKSKEDFKKIYPKTYSE